MGENVEVLETEDEGIKELSHTRILLLMGIVTFIGSVVGFIYVSKQFGIGVILGGALSFANYYWLKYSLKDVFSKAIAGDKPRFLASKYILRYLIFGLIILFIYLSKTVDVIAVILGLASFAFAIVFEGIIRIFTSLNK